MYDKWGNAKKKKSENYTQKCITDRECKWIYRGYSIQCREVGNKLEVTNTNLYLQDWLESFGSLPVHVKREKQSKD